jgi:hypothetical protein
MKQLTYYLTLFILLAVFSLNAYSQNESVITPSNRSTVNLEKNLLFYADRRMTVSQQGSISLPLDKLFDGHYMPNYSGNLDENNPWVLTIENITGYHVQAGAWIGWTTRYYNPVKFKIEVYDEYGANGTYHSWVTVANVDNYYNGSYIINLPQCIPGKVRFTVYKGEGPGNSLGLAEFFLLHNEATTAYDGLMVKYNHDGNVGIGVGNAQGGNLDVNGTIHSREVKVDLNNWGDYVFDQDYKLATLPEIEAYIKQNHHLPEIPAAEAIEKDGAKVGDLLKLQMKKIEELTLYLIDKDKQVNRLTQRLTTLENKITKRKK